MATVTKDFLLSQINGIVINKSRLSHSANFLNKSSRDVSHIVMHYTANKDDTALANAKYFQQVRRSSAHFFVEETSIYQTVELRDVAYHCGCALGYKTACRNANSFGIEMTTAGNYKVSEQTQINSAYLCAELCKLIGITSKTVDTYVLRHYDVVKTNKMCPKQYVEHKAEWTTFKTWVKNILDTGNHKGKKAESKSGSSTTAKKTTATKKKANAIVKQGQKHASEFTDVKIKADGLVGSETRKMKARVLQHAMNLDYGKTIAEDGDFGTKSKKKLGSHYVKKGEKQYMVTAAEILMELNGIDPNGVEKPGIYGNSLVKAVKKYFGGNGTKITASQFLKLIK